MKGVKAFLRESLELLYYAFFLPSRLQRRMNDWLPLPKNRKDGRGKPIEHTRPYDILTTRANPRARRFLAQCALWWAVGLIPMWVLGWGTLPIWLLLALSALLPFLAWGVAMVDVPSGLLAPLWMGLVWALNPAMMNRLQLTVHTIEAALKPWWAWETGGLTLGGAMGIGLLCGGLERWLVATHRQREAIGWSALIALVLYLGLLVVFGSGLPGMSAEPVTTEASPTTLLGEALAWGMGLGVLGGGLGIVGGPLAEGLIRWFIPDWKVDDEGSVVVGVVVAILVAVIVVVDVTASVPVEVAFVV